MKLRALAGLIVFSLLAGCARRWDDAPAPDIHDVNAMKGVSEFIAAHGWAMGTNAHELYYGDSDCPYIHGLPWYRFKDKQFPAWTQDRILYVVMQGWHDDYGGLAFNPTTNHFHANIWSFKPIGAHWYVWWTTDTPDPSLNPPKIYE